MGLIVQVWWWWVLKAFVYLKKPCLSSLLKAFFLVRSFRLMDFLLFFHCFKDVAAWSFILNCFWQKKKKKKSSVILFVPPYVICSLLFPGYFQVFFFISGFNQFNYDVPWCSFLYVSYVWVSLNFLELWI